MRKKSIFLLHIWSYLLLFSVIFTAFFVSAFPLEYHGIIYRGMFTVIYFCAIMNMERYRKQLLIFTIIVMIVSWAAQFNNYPVLFSISRILNLVFFLYIVSMLILQVARARNVTPKVIMESIVGYLLLGIQFAILVGLAGFVDPDSFNFSTTTIQYDMPVADFSQDLYYTFITMLTIGYGDFLPLKPYTRSLATIIGVFGQMYMTIIIAMLVGKFASNPVVKEDQ